MNATGSQIRSESATGLWLCSMLAVGIHVGMLSLGKLEHQPPGLVQLEHASLEVALVETPSQAPFLPPIPEPTPTLPAPSPAPLTEPSPTATTPLPLEPLTPEPLTPEPLTPEPIPPEPIPPEPIPPEPLPPEPADLTATPEPTKQPKAPGTPTQPKSAAKTAPSKAASSAPSTPSGTSGDFAAKSLGKPQYLVRPAIQYPAKSREAGEEGIVVLRITVNAKGRPTAVVVANSSGFPRLDSAALEGGWRCSVGNAFEGAQFDAPLRFSLKN